MSNKKSNNYFELDKNKRAIRRQSWLRIAKSFLLRGPEQWRGTKIGRAWDYTADFVQLTIYHDLFTQSASVVYYLLLAFVPILILIVYFTGFITRNIDISAETLAAAKVLLPEPIRDITESLSFTISAPLSILSLTVSSLTALWASSRGVGQILKSIALIYPKKEKGFTLPFRLVGVLITVVIFIVFALALIFLNFSRAIFDLIEVYLPFINLNLESFDLITYGSGFLLIFLTFYVLYFISSKRSDVNLPKVSGAFIASIAWVALSYLYSIYISQKANLSSLYGGLANIIILMLWLNFSVQIILYGAVINLQIAWYKTQDEDNYEILNEVVKEIDENESPFDYL